MALSWTTGPMDSTLRTDLYHKGKTNLDARGCMGPPPFVIPAPSLSFPRKQESRGVGCEKEKATTLDPRTNVDDGGGKTASHSGTGVRRQKKMQIVLQSVEFLPGMREKPSSCAIRLICHPERSACPERSEGTICYLQPNTCTRSFASLDNGTNDNGVWRTSPTTPPVILDTYNPKEGLLLFPLLCEENNTGSPKFTNEVQHLVKVLPWDATIHISPLKTAVKWPAYTPTPIRQIAATLRAPSTWR